MRTGISNEQRGKEEVKRKKEEGSMSKKPRKTY
jgi:hypothetical protein